MLRTTDLRLCSIMQGDEFVTEDVRPGLEAGGDVDKPGVVVRDKDVDSPGSVGGAIGGDQHGGGVVDFGEFEGGFVDGGAPIGGPFAGGEVGEDWTGVVLRPAGPEGGDGVSGAHYSMSRYRLAIAVAGNVRGIIGVEVNPTVVGGVVGPDDTVGGVDLAGARVVALVIEAVDVDLADVGVSSRRGGEPEDSEEDGRDHGEQLWFWLWSQGSS